MTDEQIARGTLTTGGFHGRIETSERRNGNRSAIIIKHWLGQKRPAIHGYPPSL